MRCLITGASGFIGRHLAGGLLQEGHTVTALVRPTSDVRQLRHLGVQLVPGDVTVPNSLARAMSNQDVVFHLAAIVGKGPNDWAHHASVGVQGTTNVVDAAEAAGVSRFIALSSYVVYAPHPDGVPLQEDAPLSDQAAAWNNYARQKVVSEQLVWQAHASGRIRATTFRPPTVIGAGDPNLVPLFRAILSSPLGMLFNDGQHRFPFVVVDDLTRALTQAAECDAAVGKAYNVAGADSVTVNALLGYFRQAGVRPVDRRGWKRAALGTLTMCSTLGHAVVRGAGHPGAPLLPRRAIRALEVYAGRRAQHDCVIDCSRAMADLGWRGISSCEESVHRAVAWHHATVAAI